jgi:PKD repeat protein
MTVTNPPPPVPVAEFAADVTSGLVPLTVNFTNLSANATGFAWNFGDGNSSAATNPSHTYTNTGLFSVTLTAIGPGGTNTITLISYIAVTNPPPVLAVIPATLAFGPVFTGSLAHASFVISNAGGSLLNATANLTPAQFVLLDAASNTTPTLALAIPAFASTNLQVRFTPIAPGAFTNFVIFLSNGGDTTNVVTGLAYGTPVVLDTILVGEEFRFSFETVAGVNYTVQFKDSLDDPIWQTLQSVVGDGLMQTITNLTTTPAQRFYRLSVP